MKFVSFFLSLFLYLLIICVLTAVVFMTVTSIWTTNEPGIAVLLALIASILFLQSFDSKKNSS